MAFFHALLPREEGFYDLFEEHARKAIDGVRVLSDLVAGLEAPNGKAHRLKEIEREGDEIKHRTLTALHRTFLTPLDRSEIQSLILQQDKILDLVHGVGELLAIYEIRETRPEFREMVRVLSESVEAIRRGVALLRDLQRGEALLEVCVEIHRLENEADGLRVAGEARLFREERDPIALMKWKEIYETVEEATDRCELVADILHGIVLEHA